MDMSDFSPHTGSVSRLGPESDIHVFGRTWATSPALADLVSAFGGQIPDPALPEAEMWAWLEGFSARWDYRGRKERNEAATAEYDEATTALVERATRDLGLQDTLPPVQAHYDHVLILGGLARGCLVRPLHAAALLADHTITTDRVTALGAFRPTSAAEEPLLTTMGLAGAKTEFDVMAAGARRAFAVDEPLEVTGAHDTNGEPAWRVECYERADGLPVDVVAAESPAEGRRANTGETYAWLAANRKIFSPSQSVLIVTTFHYRLYQLADAIRLLGIPYGVSLDAVGVVPGQVDPRLAWMPSTSALLQETRSAIRSLRQLCEAASAR